MHMHLLKLTIWQIQNYKKVDSQVNYTIQNAHPCIYSQEKMSNEIITQSPSIKINIANY